MMQGPIRRITKEHTLERKDAHIAYGWAAAKEPKTSKPFSGRWLTHNLSFETDDSEPLIAVIGSAGAAARDLLLSFAGKSKRMYALVGPTCGKNAGDLPLLRAQNLLLRRLPSVSLSAICGSRGAILWIGGGLTLQLDDTQSEDLRHLFMDIFWHETIEEAWNDQWHPVPQIEVELPPISFDATVKHSHERIPEPPEGALLHLTGDYLPEHTPARLWYPAGPDHQERLYELAMSGCEILWEERRLPELIFNGEQGELYLPHTGGHLYIKLNAGQTYDFTRLLSADAPWHFVTDLPLSKAEDLQIWLPEEKEPRTLVDLQELTLSPQTAASLRKMPDSVFLPGSEADPLARKVHYFSTILPPRLPVNAMEDGLVAQWRIFDKAWLDRLGRFGNDLQVLGAEVGMIDRANTLRNTQPSTSGNDASVFLKQIESLESEIRKIKKINAEKACMLRVEHARTEIFHKKDLLAATEVSLAAIDDFHAVQALQKAHDETKRKVGRLITEIDAREAHFQISQPLSTSFRNNLSQNPNQSSNWSNLETEAERTEAEFQKIKAQVTEELKHTKNEKERKRLFAMRDEALKVRDAAKTALEKQNKLKKQRIQGMFNLIEASPSNLHHDPNEKEPPPPASRDPELRAKRAELETAETRLKMLEEKLRDAQQMHGLVWTPEMREKKLEEHRIFKANIEKEIAELEKEAEEEFEYQDPPLEACDRVKAPTELLPKLGKLYCYKGHRYLVIENWEDLDEGEQIAEKYGAELVAPTEA